MDKKLSTDYSNPYGTWIVTTEGDVEGRSVKQLGTFTGFIDEIALYLANKCFYSLNFSKTEMVKEFKPTKDEVHVSFDIQSGTWDMNSSQRANVAREIFKNRPVTIREGQYYASFVISGKMSEEDILAIEREKILSKLSKKERETLGFK